MKKLSLIIMFLFLLSACGQSKFEKSMRSGKDFLSESRYEDAIKMFDLALIEKPSDKDAQLLMDKSKVDLLHKQSKEQLQNYQVESKIIIDEYEKVSIDFKEYDPGLITKISAADKLKELKNKSLDLGRKYNKYPDITEANNSFINAIDSSIDLYTELSKVNSTEFRTTQYKKIRDDYLQKYKDAIEKIKNY